MYLSGSTWLQNPVHGTRDWCFTVPTSLLRPHFHRFPYLSQECPWSGKPKHMHANRSQTSEHFASLTLYYILCKIYLFSLLYTLFESDCVFFLFLQMYWILQGIVYRKKHIPIKILIIILDYDLGGVQSQKEGTKRRGLQCWNNRTSCFNPISYSILKIQNNNNKE